MVKKNIGPWYMQRRIWATALSVISVVSAIYNQNELVMVCSALAGMFGLHSYISPKK